MMNILIRKINILLTENPKLTIIIMSTYNALSITSYTKFLDDVLEMKKMLKNTATMTNQPMALGLQVILMMKSRQKMKSLWVNGEKNMGY